MVTCLLRCAQFLNALMMKLKVVFYMSNEEVFKKDDLSRELALVLQVNAQTPQKDTVFWCPAKDTIPLTLQQMFPYIIYTCRREPATSWRKIK